MSGNVLINNLTSRVERFKEDINFHIAQIIEANSDLIIAENVENQIYSDGVDTKGVSFPSYAESTKKQKKRKGQPTNRVTLKDSGAFHESIGLDIRDDEFELITENETYKWLRGRYGENILGLRAEFIREFTWKIVYPELLKRAKSVIYGIN